MKILGSNLSVIASSSLKTAQIIESRFGKTWIAIHFSHFHSVTQPSKLFVSPRLSLPACTSAVIACVPRCWDSSFCQVGFLSFWKDLPRSEQKKEAVHWGHRWKSVDEIATCWFLIRILYGILLNFSIRRWIWWNSWISNFRNLCRLCELPTASSRWSMNPMSLDWGFFYSFLCFAVCRVPVWHAVVVVVVVQVAGPHGCESNPSHLGHVTHDETTTSTEGEMVGRIWRWKTLGDSSSFRLWIYCIPYESYHSPTS